MQIGEFFVSLGVKGAEKTVGALSSVKSGLGEIYSTSIEVKAGLLAVVYALEKVIAGAGQMGTSLVNFSALTGFSSEVLQRWQHAGKAANIPAEEVQQNIVRLQQTMEKAAYTGQVPQLYNQFRGVLAASGINFDLAKAVADKKGDYTLKAFREYSNLEKNESLRRIVLGEFFSPGMVTGLIEKKFSDKALNDFTPITTDQGKQLDRLRSNWDNLFFNLKTGSAKALGTVLEKTHASQGEFDKSLIHIRDRLHKNVIDVFSTLADKIGYHDQHVAPLKLLKSSPEHHPSLDHILKVAPAPNPITPNMLAPNLSKGVQPNSTQNNNINQSFNFQTDGSDHKQVGDATKRGVLSAYIQIPVGPGGQIA